MAASLYRRHRPRTFADVVGQEHVVRTLSNALEQDRIHHAYLFVGSRGTGKTSMAKILAASLNCSNGGPTLTPCGKCESCVSIQTATSLDVVEMDAASNNSVDDIRDLRERVAYAPVAGRYKVYILDEAHMLTPAAWNAFLKTLEEPPPHTIFVLATTEANKVLPTVVDRCHRFDFGRPSVSQIASVLRRVADSESIEIPDEAIALVARSATGSFRDALGTLEQLLAYSGASIALEDVLAVLGAADADLIFGAVDAVSAGDARSALLAAARLAESGRDLGRFLGDLEAHARSLMIVQVLGDVPPELHVTPEQDERLLEQARRVGAAEVVRLLELIAVAFRSMKDGADARTQLELALVKAATPELEPSVKALLARITRLEENRPAAPPSGPKTPARPETPAGRATAPTNGGGAAAPTGTAAPAQGSPQGGASAHGASAPGGVGSPGQGGAPAHGAPAPSVVGSPGHGGAPAHGAPAPSVVGSPADEGAASPAASRTTAPAGDASAHASGSLTHGTTVSAPHDADAGDAPARGGAPAPGGAPAHGGVSAYGSAPAPGGVPAYGAPAPGGVGSPAHDASAPGHGSSPERGRTAVAITAQVEGQPPVAVSAALPGAGDLGPEEAQALADGAAAAVARELATEADPTPAVAAVAVIDPEAPAGSASIGLSLDEFGPLWPAVVDSLRAEKPMLAALLEDASPTSLADDGLTLAWPESSAFLKRKAEDPANRDLIAKAIRAVTGTSLRLAYELRADGAVGPVASAPAISEEDLVKRFMDEFDAEELPPEPEEQT